MKKLIVFISAIVLVAIIFIVGSCEKSEVTPSASNLAASTARKAKPRASAVAFSVYYSPDSSAPYVCYTPCNTVPAPTGLELVSNSGTVIQIILKDLGYTSGFSSNYADSIQYIVGNGTNGVCWTEKWCNTNGAFMPISQLQGLLNQAGVTSTNNLTATVIPYGSGGQAGLTFTTPPFSL